MNPSTWTTSELTALAHKIRTESRCSYKVAYERAYAQLVAADNS